MNAARIRELNAELSRLKSEDMATLSPCSSCGGTGKQGIPTYKTICSVCRGNNVDMGELWELRKKWGEV